MSLENIKVNHRVLRALKINSLSLDEVLEMGIVKCCDTQLTSSAIKLLSDEIHRTNKTIFTFDTSVFSPEYSIKLLHCGYSVISSQTVKELMSAPINLHTIRDITRLSFFELCECTTCQIKELNTLISFLYKNGIFLKHKHIYLNISDKLSVISQYLHNENIEFVNEIGLSNRVCNILKKNGIEKTIELLSLTREEILRFNQISIATLDDINEILFARRLSITNEERRVCNNCDTVFWRSCKSENNICNTCIDKKARIAMINTIDVNVKEATSFEDDDEVGFAIEFNVKNIGSKLIKVAIKDIYVVCSGERINPKYYYTGYYFGNEYIIPDTLKTNARVFVTSKSLKDGDEFIVSFSNTFSKLKNYTFKFTYDCDSWKLNDYYG